HLAMTHLSSNAPPPTETSTLSLHDALPIFFQKGGTDRRRQKVQLSAVRTGNQDTVAGIELPRSEERDGIRKLPDEFIVRQLVESDRKSTRLNSSHVAISYAVFCLKKKKRQK